MRASIAARLGLCLVLLLVRAVDVPALWDELCRGGHRHLTTGYLLWKHLGVEADEGVRFGGLCHDGDRDGLVRGRNLAELRERFPELKVGGVPSWHQALHEPYLTDVEHYWLGDSWWLLELRDGRGESLRYCKG